MILHALSVILNALKLKTQALRKRSAHPFVEPGMAVLDSKPPAGSFIRPLQEVNEHCITLLAAAARAPRPGVFPHPISPRGPGICQRPLVARCSEPANPRNAAARLARRLPADSCHSTHTCDLDAGVACAAHPPASEVPARHEPAGGRSGCLTVIGRPREDRGAALSARETTLGGPTWTLATASPELSRARYPAHPRFQPSGPSAHRGGVALVPLRWSSRSSAGPRSLSAD
jgi:hypothetical protein